MIETRLPRLLDANLKERGRLYPKSQSAEINLTPLTTASLTLEDGSGVRVRDFVELYTARGTAGIFRVKSPSAGYGTYTDTISLEHGICVLGDAIIPGEGTKSGTVREVLSFILAHQSTKVGGVPMWVLGEVDVPDEETISYDYRSSNTLHALLGVMDLLGGYKLDFDQKTFPWVVSVKEMENTPSCEGRLGRNVFTARVTIDDSELCTRVYSHRLEGGYMQLEDEPAWGVVEKPLDFDDEMPIETVEAECRRYLMARREPLISVEIDGLELAAQTGEKLDSFDVGRMMRLALPKYGVVVNERITTISYSAMIEQPETVRVYLANKLKDTSSSLAGLTSSVETLNSTTTRYGNTIRTNTQTITNLKDAQDGFKEFNDKVVHWFSSVEIDLDATEEGARFGALASYEQVHGLEEEFDTRISEAELILNGEPGSAQAGLVARVFETEKGILDNSEKILAANVSILNLESDLESATAELSASISKNEEEISRASLTLYGDETTAQAGLVARVGDNEASLLLQADEIGTLFTVKADRTYVQNLIADEIEAAKAEIQNAYLATISTNTLYALDFYLGMEHVDKTTISVVTGIAGRTANVTELEMLTTGIGSSYTVNLGELDSAAIAEAINNLKTEIAASLYVAEFEAQRINAVNTTTYILTANGDATVGGTMTASGRLNANGSFAYQGTTMALNTAIVPTSAYLPNYVAANVRLGDGSTMILYGFTSRPMINTRSITYMGQQDDDFEGS